MCSVGILRMLGILGMVVVDRNMYMGIGNRNWNRRNMNVRNLRNGNTMIHKLTGI